MKEELDCPGNKEYYNCASDLFAFFARRACEYDCDYSTLFAICEDFQKCLQSKKALIIEFEQRYISWYFDSKDIIMDPCDNRKYAIYVSPTKREAYVAEFDNNGDCFCYRLK